MKEKLEALWMKYVNRETITYIIFGVLTTLVNWAIYYGLRELNVDYKIAQIAAWIGAVIFAFFTNKHFVFQSTDYTPRVLLAEFWKFIAARLLTFAIETAFLLLTVDVLHQNDRIMKLVISVVVIILNYVFSKLFIFNRKEKEKADED